MILRRFVDDNGRLHVFDRTRPERGVYATVPKNAFVHRDLNALINLDGTRNIRLEVWYSELEGAIAPLIDAMIETVCEGKTPLLTEETQRAWNTFVYHSHKRAHDAFDRLGLTRNFEDQVRHKLERHELLTGPVPTEVREAVLSKNAIQRILKNVSVNARSRGGNEIVDALQNRGLAFGVASSRRSSFVVGDHPLARMGGTGHCWTSSRNRGFQSHRSRGFPVGCTNTAKLFHFKTHMIRRVNELIVTNSNVVAGRSPKLIRSLAGIRQQPGMTSSLAVSKWVEPRAACAHLGEARHFGGALRHAFGAPAARRMSELSALGFGSPRKRWRSGPRFVAQSRN